MVSLQKDFAVIAVVRALIEQNESRINVETVKQFSRDLESKTGIATINRFTAESLNMFFRNNPEYFKRTYDKDTGGNPIYEVRVEQYEDIVDHMIKHFDPAINYPIEFLDAAGILQVLVS